MGAGLLQRIHQCALDAIGCVQSLVRFSDDGVHPFEAEAGDAAQLIRSAAQNLHTGRAKELIHFDRRGWCDLERAQQTHQVAQGAALGVRCLDIGQLALGNAGDLGQTFGVMLQDVQCISAKTVHDGIRELGADPFDKARTQIGPDALRRLLDDLPPLFHLQLTPVFAGDPFAVQFQLHRAGAGQIMPHRHKQAGARFVPAAAELRGVAGLGRDRRVLSSDHDDGKVVCFIKIDGAVIGTVVWHTPLHFLVL